MPFLIGLHPVRRTVEYLSRSPLVLKPFVRIVTVHYNKNGENSEGAREFVYWHLGQLQHKNPSVQVLTLRDMTPSPFIRLFFDSGKDLLLDVDWQSRQDIIDRLLKSFCKTAEEIKKESVTEDVLQNPANFGYGCKRHCICEVPGQVPCPALIPLPYHMRGRYRFGHAELDESKYL